MRASDVRAALAASYRQPEWAIFFEVADGTGMHKRRSADAVAINMWPSRGMAINGFEVKVDRSDWRRELADPAKAESIAQFCDFWWVAAPKGLIDPATLPATWGLTEVDEKGALRIKVQAKERKSREVTRSFFTALCRSRSQQDEGVVAALVEKKLNAAREEDRRTFERRVAEKTKAAAEVVERHAVFAKAFAGYGPLAHLDEAEIVRGLVLLKELGILSGYGPLKNLFNQARSTIRALEKIEAEHFLEKEER